MSARSSLNLADVRMSCQPVQVQDDELHPSLLSPRKPSVTVSDLSPAFQEIINRLVQQHLVELSRMDGVLQLRQAELDAAKMRIPEAHEDTTAKSFDEDKKVGFEKSTSCETPDVLKSPPDMKHKVDANQILDAFEKDQDAQQLFRNAEKMIDGEFDVEAAREFWARWKTLSCFRKTRLWLQSSRYEMLIAFILCINVLWMAFELQFSGTIAGYEMNFFSERPMLSHAMPAWELAIEVGDMFFTVFFVLDVLIRICILRLDFWRVCANYVDLAVSITSLVEVTILYAVDLPVHPVLFRLLRLGKLARAIRMVTMTSVLGSLQLLVKCLAASCNMLFWSFCLLTFVQCVAGLIVSTLCRDFILDEKKDLGLREEVFRYYGTFTRTFLTMFEILFANWGPPCRVLAENFSEWFSVFFLIYRCVLGFAVLNVVNSVFVQQTMKTASSDEELAFKQKEKDAQMYTRKVKRLFQTIDDSGDGAINFQEFSKLVQSPKLKFWTAQLELEYHDLLSLFEFLDNGDGEITLMEFIEGAARLRGNAKALDIWRIETKMEVLIEEVLKEMKGLGKEVKLQDVFDNSMFRHIKTTTIGQVSEGPERGVSVISNVISET